MVQLTAPTVFTPNLQAHGHGQTQSSPSTEAVISCSSFNFFCPTPLACSPQWCPCWWAGSPSPSWKCQGKKKKKKVYTPPPCLLHLSSPTPGPNLNQCKAHLVCPTRWQRSSACLSLYGLQSMSCRMTTLAEVRLMPRPPALVDSRNTKNVLIVVKNCRLKRSCGSGQGGQTGALRIRVLCIHPAGSPSNGDLGPNWRAQWSNVFTPPQENTSENDFTTSVITLLRKK